ncbi:unnamed protein product, partial [Adineta ricciae]
DPYEILWDSIEIRRDLNGSDHILWWDGSTGEANQKSYSYLDQMSYESIFNGEFDFES